MIVRVDSSGDPRVAEYRHVGDAEWLRRHGLFVAEGRLVVRRLLAASSRFAVRSILVTETALRALADIVPEECDVFVSGGDALSEVAGYDFHRGCLALGTRTESADAWRTFGRARRLVALEGIGNPDNMGGIFRSAAAFGADGVLIDSSCGDPLYRKAIRTSMGAALRVPFARISDLAALDAFRGRFEIVALTPGADAIGLDEFARRRIERRPAMLLAGAEGPGLTPTALARADVRVRIPIADDVDSLNVVVAVSIALHVLR